ncbi:30S ribosomal protein S21 [Candidatus Parcubacteria bacterium]|nr:MAG: 30S ribosomal protein S21 [Candidatus Parcubacteria bacterium]
MIEVKKKEGESANALLFRFSKRVKRSGVLREANKRRFRDRTANRRKRRLSAIHRETKRKEVERLRKLGLL